jgi:hypothetical protein
VTRFALVGGDDTLLGWEDGELTGYPDSLLDEAREALTAGPQGATPTGPFFDTSTPEGAWLALAPLVPDVTEEIGKPFFAEQEDELDSTPE